MTKDILLIFLLDIMTGASKLLSAVAIIVYITFKIMRKDEHRSNSGKFSTTTVENDSI